MNLSEPLMFMNVKIVPIARCDPSAQKQQRGKIKNYFMIKNGNLKKNI